MWVACLTARSLTGSAAVSPGSLRENSGINFPPNEICIGSLIVGSVLQHYRYKITHPNFLGQKFPEHSLNINLIEKLEEETNYFNKLHDAHFVK